MNSFLSSSFQIPAAYLMNTSVSATVLMKISIRHCRSACKEESANQKRAPDCAGVVCSRCCVWADAHALRDWLHLLAFCSVRLSVRSAVRAHEQHALPPKDRHVVAGDRPDCEIAHRGVVVDETKSRPRSETSSARRSRRGTSHVPAARRCSSAACSSWASSCRVAASAR